MKELSVSQILRGLRPAPAKKPPRAICHVCERPASLGIHAACLRKKTRERTWWRRPDLRKDAMTRAELVRELVSFVNKLEPERLTPEQLARRETLRDEAGRLFTLVRRNDI